MNGFKVWFYKYRKRNAFLDMHLPFHFIYPWFLTGFSSINFTKLGKKKFLKNLSFVGFYSLCNIHHIFAMSSSESDSLLIKYNKFELFIGENSDSEYKCRNFCNLDYANLY